MDPIVIVGGGIAFFVLAVGAWMGARKLGLFAAEHSVQSTDEDADAFGTEVQVLIRMSETETGRISFGGSSWPARSVRGEIVPGATARIVDRENLLWIVELVAPPKPKLNP